MMTKTQQLQQLWDDNKGDYQYDWDIQWRGFGGWWAIPSESRWFGDAGEFLGFSFRDAELTLRLLLG